MRQRNNQNGAAGSAATCARQTHRQCWIAARKREHIQTHLPLLTIAEQRRVRAKFEHAVPKQHQRAAAVAAAPADGLRRNKQRRHSRAAAATRAAMQLAAVQRAAAREQLEIRNRAAKDKAIGGRRPHGVRSGECCVAEGKAAQPSAHTARESVQPVGCGTRATASTGLNA